MHRSLTIGFGFVSMALLVAVAGCGESRPERVPVSGQVLIDGKPLEHGFIRLIAEGDRPAGGKIGPDGRFQLTCFADKDGSVMGTHKVIVVGMEILGSNSQRWHAPKKYANAATSGLTTTIDGSTDSLVINLTWDGEEPFVETFEGE